MAEAPSNLPYTTKAGEKLYLKINYNRITSRAPLALVQRTLAEVMRVNSAMCASDSGNTNVNLSSCRLQCRYSVNCSVFNCHK
jgi:hypothetical protein